MSSVSPFTCDSDRFQLSLRLDWFYHSDVERIDTRHHLALCPDVRDSMIMAETSVLLQKMHQFKARLRFNTSNYTKRGNDWSFHFRRTMRHLSSAEKILETFLLQKSLYDLFHPAKLGTAIFFNAANLMRSFRRLLPLMAHTNLKRFPFRQSSEKMVDPFWQSLESRLLHDAFLDVVLPDSLQPCSVFSALQQLLISDNFRIQAGSDWSGVLGQEIKRSLDLAQQQLICMHENSGARFLEHFTFPKAFVFFHVLDRLDCRMVAAIKPPTLGEDVLHLRSQTFLMHVLPSPHVESNHVRGKGEFHCGGEKLLLEQIDIAKAKGSSFRFVEVGASLGGCTWSVLTSYHRATALAIEPYKPAADALRRTALENGLTQRVTVSEVFVSTNSSWCPKILRSGVAHNLVADKHDLPRNVVPQHCQTSTLSDILDVWSSETVDLLRIHVNGFEMDVLTSAIRSFNRIRTLAIAVAEKARFTQIDYDPVAIARLLLDSGCAITLQPKQLQGEAVVNALGSAEILSPQTMTLMAFCSGFSV